MIQMLWIRGSLSKLEQLAIRSFLAQGHQVDVYTYDACLQGLPEGARQCDGREILPWNEVFDHQPAGLATFSDLFRYSLLAAKGGWWCDCDLIALRPFPKPKDIVFASERHPNGSTHPVPGIMYSPPGHPVMELLRDTALARDPASIEWCEVGPDLVQRIVAERGLEDRVTSHMVFCPLDIANWLDALLPGKAPEFGPESLAVHLWHEIWKRFGVHKDEDHAPNSLFEILKRRYGVL